MLGYIMTILAAAVFIICIIIIIMIIIFAIIDKIYDKIYPFELDSKILEEVTKNKIDKKNEPIIYYYLYLDLLKYAHDNNIDVIYGDKFFAENNLMDCCGLHASVVYRNLSGKISFISDEKIYILNEVSPEDILLCTSEDELIHLSSVIAVLGHEIGHNIALHECGDRSEEAADYYGCKLCRGFLTEKDMENQYIQIFMDCRFSKKDMYLK